MPPKIKTCHGNAQGGKGGRKLFVAAHVLGHAMGYLEDCRYSFGLPDYRRKDLSAGTCKFKTFFFYHGHYRPRIISSSMFSRRAMTICTVASKSNSVEMQLVVWA